jgi:RNA polymerase sigma-70 factor, ECF subfamily
MVAAMDALTRFALGARAGDDCALESLVSATYEQVRRFCATLVDEDSAEDVAQATFVRAIRALPQFRAEASARTWLLSIARHTCIDELRSKIRRRRRDVPLTMTSSRHEPAVADASQGPIVDDLVRQLESEKRVAFVLTQVIGLTYEEAAEVCECPTGTIRSRVARARSDLFDLITNAGECLRGNSQTSGYSKA